MDPISIYQMGRVRQQEILDWAAQQQDRKPVRQYISDFGSLLVRAGHKLVETANPVLDAQPIAPQPNPECC
jgi:hypothetical protein